MSQKQPGATAGAGGAGGGGALAGVRVIDLTTVLMGPWATQILGDHGADVIKVEPPAGDVSRNVGPMRGDRMGHFFLNGNRNKRSVVLDLKHPEGLAALLRLAATVDVVVTNIRPAALARLGISYAALARHNPRIILLNLIGYGQEGRYASKAAYDDLIQGATAIPALFARYDATLAPRYAPLAMADRVVALHAVGAIGMALLARERSGTGQEIELPMFELMAEFVLGDHLAGHTFVPPAGPTCYQRLISPDRRPYATRDGHVCVLVYSDRNWRDFLAEIGRADLFDTDPRFMSLRSRTDNISALYALVAEAMLTRTTAEWLAVFERLDIAAMPMHDVEALIDDPHLAEVGFFQEVEHPTEGRLRMMAPVGRWSATPPGLHKPAPLLGEHSRELLREAGYDAAEIARLLAAGISRAAGA